MWSVGRLSFKYARVINVALEFLGVNPSGVAVPSERRVKAVEVGVENGEPGVGAA